MPLTTLESNTSKKTIEENLGFEITKNSEFLTQAKLERAVFEIGKDFRLISDVRLNSKARFDYFVPKALTILQKLPLSPAKIELLQTLGIHNILLQLKPKEKISEFSSRILARLAQRQNEMHFRHNSIQTILREKFCVQNNEDFGIRSLVNSANFILNYLEAQNIKGRNNFSILELAAGELGERGYGQDNQLYVPLVCEVLTQSGFAADGIDRYQDIDDQNLDFNKVQGIDLTLDDWEKDIQHKYNMVIFLRNWHSEVFLKRYRDESKVVIFEKDFLVNDFVRNLLPKVYDILENDGVFFTTHPFKKDLFDVETVFAKFHLEVFYNLDGLILARKQGLEVES